MTIVEFGGHVSLAEKEGAGMAERRSDTGHAQVLLPQRMSRSGDCEEGSGKGRGWRRLWLGRKAGYEGHAVGKQWQQGRVGRGWVAMGRGCRQEQVRHQRLATGANRATSTTNSSDVVGDKGERGAGRRRGAVVAAVATIATATTRAALEPQSSKGKDNSDSADEWWRIFFSLPREEDKGEEPLQEEIAIVAVVPQTSQKGNGRH
ncbi:hypothetical protein B296_00047702 [Ensete ventricosum]|uniref:Uncharacterized protein n=1 Tax=Ensete ventricosum TaxID=4639 RepID=A0A426YJS2_ENSVE|nr:hypothetical protein B296_00047702 [Ensete ventricosum]